MDKQFKAPRKRCRTENGIADMVFEVSTRLDHFLDALERLLEQLGPIEDLEGLELVDDDCKT